MSPAEFALRAVLTKQAQIAKTRTKQAAWSLNPAEWEGGGPSPASGAAIGALLGGGAGAAYGAMSSKPGEKLRNAALYGLGGGAAGGLAGLAVGNSGDPLKRLPPGPAAPSAGPAAPMEPSHSTQMAAERQRQLDEEAATALDAQKLQMAIQTKREGLLAKQKNESVQLPNSIDRAKLQAHAQGLRDTQKPPSAEKTLENAVLAMQRQRKSDSGNNPGVPAVFDRGTGGLSDGVTPQFDNAGQFVPASLSGTEYPKQTRPPALVDPSSMNNPNYSR